MRKSKHPLIEFCITDLQGAQLAAEYGADRIELCVDLSTGGLTPSYGLIAACAGMIETHVLIRPRPGNFTYSKEEVNLMAADIRAAHQAGASGAVFGCLTPDQQIDLAANQRLVEVCKEQELLPIFHRAFDYCQQNPLLALEQLIDLGFARVLTAGQGLTALAGLANLEQLQTQAAGRITILAGGGVGPANAPALLTAGITELHCSVHLKTTIASPMGGQLSYDLEKIKEMTALVS